MSTANSNKSLISRVKVAITMRVLGSLLLLGCFLVIESIYNVNSQLEGYQYRISQQCAELENFVVSQALIDNLDAANVKIQSFNNHHAINVTWAKSSTEIPHKFVWLPPFSWKFYYPIHAIGVNYGYFLVTGSFLQDRQLISGLIKSLLIFIVFSVIIGFLLFPLINTIPRKLFIHPIDHLLNILNHRKQDLSLEQIQTDPAMSIEIQEIEKKIISLIQEERNSAQKEAEMKVARSNALFGLAARVAHDIRSPIAVLEMGLQSIYAKIDKKHLDILRQAVQSVRNIADNLLVRYRTDNFEDKDGDQDETVLLFALLSRAVAQKRYEQGEKNSVTLVCECDHESEACWVRIQPLPFKRMLSNLMNNAAESMKRAGKIRIQMQATADQAVISITDQGCGIAPEHLEGVLTGKSLKHPGQGLGLSGACAYMQSVGGQLDIESSVGSGTTVKLTLERCRSPAWCVQYLDLVNKQGIIIVDDDPSIHALWQHRLQPHGLPVHYFSSPNEAMNFVEQLPNLSKWLMLVDYEFDGEMNGLNFLQLIDAKANHAYLVTSHADESSLQAEVKSWGYLLLPKALISSITLMSIT